MTSNGPEVLWEVVHSNCPVRAEPHFDGKVLGWKRRGTKVACSEITTDGWLKVADGHGWLLSDMQGEHKLRSLLRPRAGQDLDLAVDEPQPQGICCLEVVFAQVAVRCSPSRDAMALCYRRKGELIFARSQNFSGWLRLAGEEGWMLAYAPEHGPLLRLRDTQASVDLWSLCDLWTAVRRKRRMLTPADVKALKEAEEGTKLMAEMDFEHHVSTGNAEPLVEDGLLLQEDLERPEAWIRQRIFARSLQRMAREEPPFCDLCPPDFRLTPRPLPLELYQKVVPAEVQGPPESPPSAREPNGASRGSAPERNGYPRGAPTPEWNGFSRGGGACAPERNAFQGASGSRGGMAGDFSLGGSKSSQSRKSGNGFNGFGKGSKGFGSGFGKGGKGFGSGFGKGFGKMPDLGEGMNGEMGISVVPVEVNGEELLMTEGGLILDPETQAPVGVLNPATGEVQEITEEHLQKLMESLGQIQMVELEGRPYILMAGLLVDPQTQEVPYKVEPDGTVVDMATGEACGMVDLDTGAADANVVTKTPKSFKDEDLDAHGWFERAKELVADDYYYQAASAYTEALQCCQEERAVELDFEVELLKGRAVCWRKMGEFKSLLEDAEKLISYGDDLEAKEWKQLALEELRHGRR